MEHTTDQKNWEPIEGLSKQKRPGLERNFLKKEQTIETQLLKIGLKGLNPK